MPIEHNREIIVGNVIQYNEALYKEIHEKTQYPPLTIELMRITLKSISEAMNKANLAHKKRFFDKCLDLC